MDSQPVTSGQIKQALDACRAGSQDLASPELRQVARQLAEDPQLQATYARLQKLDIAIGAALSDVPVPEGLPARILAQLERSATVKLRSSELPSAASHEQPAQGGAHRGWNRRFSRRNVMRVGTGLAATLLVSASLAYYLRSPSASLDQLVIAAGAGNLPGSAWQPLAEAPRNLPLPAGFARASSWQSVTVSGAVGAAYNLSTSPRRRAVLYVLPLHIAGLPSSPPSRPQSETGGQLIGAWQSGGLVYVLVVSGPADELRYRNLVNRSLAPLA